MYKHWQKMIASFLQKSLRSVKNFEELEAQTKGLCETGVLSS